MSTVLTLTKLKLDPELDPSIGPRTIVGCHASYNVGGLQPASGGSGVSGSAQLGIEATLTSHFSVRWLY